MPPKISGRADRPATPKPVVLPKVLTYPKIHPLSQTQAILKDHLCYIIKHYGTEGVSVLVMREPKLDKVTVLCGDWNGNNIDLDPNSDNRIVQAALVFVKEDLKLFLQLMQTIKLNQAQFFLAIDQNNQLTLTDIQIAVGKLSGPGMVRDLFGNIYRTQEVLKVEALDERSLEYIGKGTGTYEGDLIVKPSKFTTFSPGPDGPLVPLYAEVKRG